MKNLPTLNPTPSRRRVAKEQFLAVGIAIRPLAVVAVPAMVGLLLVLRFDALRQGGGISLNPETALLVALFAPLLPIAIWKREHRFWRSYFASLPVERARHALVKIAVGWCWLMVLVTAFLLCMLAVTAVTGGEIGADEMRIMAGDVPQELLLADVDALARHWTTPAWQWAAFFTAATVTYLIGSTVVLAGSRTRRCLAGLAVVLIFLLIVDDEVVDLGVVARRLDLLMVSVAEGRYGLQTLLAMGNTTNVTTTTGEGVVVWSELPTPEAWLAATFLWTGAAAVGLVAVLWRSRAR